MINPALATHGEGHGYKRLVRQVHRGADQLHRDRWTVTLPVTQPCDDPGDRQQPVVGAR
jgi:hypothetical protein